MAREQMHYDVVIIGAGPAGLAAACRLRQLDNNLSVCLLEKGADVGAHILSGAVFEPRALNELFPDWKNQGAPLETAVSAEDWQFLSSATNSLQIPNGLLPGLLHNNNNYIISLGRLCQWLAEKAAELGVDIFPGFAASQVLYRDDGSVGGVITGDMGRAADGSEKPEFVEGIELHGKYTLFCEGARGHLGKELIAHFNLDQGKDPQHYAIGIKEIWRVPAAQHKEGLVMHSLGWPLSETNTSGGGFLYHLNDTQIAVGLITDLCYDNPHLSPFDEFQRYKHHPKIAQYLQGGERLGYGARAIVKGGIQSQPQMFFAGGLLLGDDAGTLNFAKIKGSHTAMKSGMIAAEILAPALAAGRANDSLSEFETAYKNSWAYEELYEQRNVGPAQQKFGSQLGSVYAFIDMTLRGKLPWTLRNSKADHTQLKLASESKKIDYPKPDNKLSFDKLSSVYLSNTNHAENQPCHLQLKDPNIPVAINLPKFDEPAQRYCPAGVYEIVANENGDKRLQINSQNCVHCKTCDIKDPTQNIQWVTPEGGGGPNYSAM
ncbi:electron transfer flavoprotein-ubiquinone oxidoreductase [Cellvibrio zantedeschiae]|uniref:Electron transfer flavoprotein-ubiquinone oxidoreductase n=1 Tax=Cellvibrio zantedeschiae TaxID=1237077 RepID=A0ABQ3AYH7_9GAMM|nr:electron transfer flavoprotein-ubiquinone oxidoreductase [Cellvibrio zantedeschiae]GGY69814.1 electron transfer flavoprotein-ubiquinone oxidoreductase [Cellvibrio zantedeschiae]